MILLAAGVLLFALAHLFPGLLPGSRSHLRARWGEARYKALISVGVLAGIALIIVGWRSAVPSGIYLPPPALRHPAMALLVMAFWLLVISQRPSRLRQWVRHPQLTAVLLWASAHLLLNGDSRSLALFGGLALWALVEIPLINRREGVWIKDDKPPLTSELINLLLTAAVVMVVMYLHPWFAGVSVLPG
jgi:uncharacterized membrane protein